MDTGFNISSSGMMAQRTRMNVISNNIANSETAHNVNGKRVPFRRREVIFSPQRAEDGAVEGVSVSDIEKDPSPFRKEYRPGHPAANEDGIVKMPNVNPIVEMVDMMSASRAYEANATAFENTRSMNQTAIQLLA